MTQNTKKQQANPWLINPTNYQAIKQERKKSESLDVICKQRRNGEKDNLAAH
jgi:hypothetical protein